MKYLPFEIIEFNDCKEDQKITLNSDRGTLFVCVGKLHIWIQQNEDGKSVVIETTDVETCEQDLGSLEVYYSDIIDLSLNEDGTHPLKP